MEPAGDPRALWFMVEDDDAEPSQAMTSVGRNIDDLKKVIHAQREDIPVSEMILHKLNHPIPLEPAETLTKRLPPQVADVSIALRGSSRKILEFFPELPTEDHLHVVVKKRHVLKGTPTEANHGRLRVITPPEAEVGISVIETKINNILESFHDDIERYLKNPEPAPWIPPDNASDFEFLRNLRLPSYANGKPSLLFHNLNVCDEEEIENMFGRRAPHMFICNTSGSGKTRRMLEGLTKYWGFYMVASPDTNGVGIQDVHNALIRMSEYQEWESDLRRLSPELRSAQHEVNRRIASRELRKVLVARIVVFELFLQLAIKVDTKLQEKHKRIWLLFQLLPPIRNPFLQIIQCLRKASIDALDILTERLDHIRDTHMPQSNFIFGLDEAQQAARSYPYSCISSNSNEVFRSIMRTIAEVFTPPSIRLVVSGTGLSLVELQEAMASGVGKPAHNILVYHDLGIFDKWEKLRPFLARYIPTSMLESPSGRCLQKRMREYLLGRYRFSVSFVEYLLMTGLQSPHRLLNEFIKVHTTCFPGDIGKPFVSTEPDLQIAIDLRGFDWERLDNDQNAQMEAAQIIQSHLTMGKVPSFGPVTDRLVEYGIARLRGGHKFTGHIVEPLAFLSVMMWLENRNVLNMKTNLRRLAYGDSRGSAFEEMVLLYLLRILRDPIPLSAIFDFHGTPPAWANEAAQIIGRLDGSNVAVAVLGGAPENPGLGVVQYAESIEDVICWLQGSDASVALIASNLFGPDLMILCRLLSDRIICVIAQQKSYTTGNKDSMNTKTMVKAITSLHRDQWFKTEASDQRQKLIDAIEQYPVLCFVAGYPLPPNLNSTAKSVVRACNSIKPYFLASLTLDTFKANFISEDEATNILRPLEVALARRRQPRAQKRPRKHASTQNTGPVTRRMQNRKRKFDEIN